jgi:GNAT superfamily N-acetyltransferase
MTGFVTRVAGEADTGAIAELRALWSAGTGADPAFERRMAAWLEAEGGRRTTFLAVDGGRPLGMASVFEYRRMPKPGRPDSRWGYVSNVFVRPECRRRGIASALLGEIVALAERRGYARLVLSPSDEALELYRRAGFGEPGSDLLLRPGR